ncbi:MAG TPA: cobalamin biosynthesis protein CbiX [Oxalobacteraceae bacterium]|jgi:sirohydrochlorin cobaltochelatase|nr:cobalamin biosynthesis protein CbiX [Oxalobacteraceae bacterium]HCN88772.1 cobalamin biosynthesis protein CbiX [Oxalobacteraceae bacterium]
MKRRALILFAHGARDPRWAAPFERLRDLIQAQQPDVAVVLAFLELMTPSLPELVEQLVHEGCGEVTVVPVFLGQSGHVLRDVPPLIDGLRSRYPTLVLKLAGAVGEDADVLNAIARYCVGALAKP